MRNSTISPVREHNLFNSTVEYSTPRILASFSAKMVLAEVALGTSPLTVTGPNGGPNILPYVAGAGAVGVGLGLGF